MTKLFITLSLSLFCILNAHSQCSTTNAESCVCKDGSNNCDLLPDITISWYALENHLDGPTEYSQTGNGNNDGRLRVSGSTPNIGLGPFTARGVDNDGYRWFVCGTDTFSIYDPGATTSFTCPDGGTAKQIIFQRIYHKNNEDMSYWDRMMPNAMTYHPEHAHNHFDEWGLFSLRIEDESEPDPRNWDMVSEGHKLGFCLMDYGTCSYYEDHCKDDNTTYNEGVTLMNGDFPNWGLGGGSYGCGMVEQGISSGYTDIYSEYLDGMWIDIPPGTCNGDYWIIYEVDPHDVVLEENETNNYTAIPVTLTEQADPGFPITKISADKFPVICEGDNITLTATAGLSYLWSTGATDQSITVGPGSYDVEVTTYCGTATSSPFVVSAIPVPETPVVEDEIVCAGEAANFTTTGSNVEWYNSYGSLAGIGNSFLTPPLEESVSYYAIANEVALGTLNNVGKFDNSGGGEYYNGDNALIFDVYEPFTLKSVKVYAQGDGYRTIELYNAIGVVEHSGIFYIKDGEQIVNLNFKIEPGLNYEITAAGSENLFRNNSGVSYPYEIEDVLSIKNSTGGEEYYYSFYDWGIETGGGKCSSGPVDVEAIVVTCTGLEDHPTSSQAGFNLYPNPNDGYFNIEMLIPDLLDVEFYIYDLTGRLVKSILLETVQGNNNYAMDLNGLKKGLYFISFNHNGKFHYKKFVKH